MRRGWEALPKHYGRPFVSGWAVEAICEHLEAVTRGELTRLLINVPPGCTKSMTTCVYWPAWEWGALGRPELSYLFLSHSSDNTIRDNVYARDLVNSDWFQGLWGDEFGWKGDQNLKTYYENTKGGSRFAGAMRKGITGKRGDRVVIDDPHDVEKAESADLLKRVRRWFSESLPTRVNDQESTPFVIIMQRVHESDLSGHVLAKELGYEHLCLPMEWEPEHPFPSTRFVDPRTKPGELLWPERFTRKAVDDLKTVFRSFGGTYAEAGQLRQAPTPRGGGMFKERFFRTRALPPEPDEIIAGPVRGWDLAGTEDDRAAYTAGVKLCRVRSGATVVLDVQRAQLESAEVYAFMKRVADADGHGVVQSIPQDPGQSGKDQKRHLGAYLVGHVLHFSPESGSKELRAMPLASQGDAGNLELVEAPWNDEFRAEAIAFPKGSFKDQVDAASRAFGRITQPGELIVGAAPRVIGR